MLVLSRKIGEKIVIGSHVLATVISVRGNSVRLGFEAPREISIVREELFADCDPPKASAFAEITACATAV